MKIIFFPFSNDTNQYIDNQKKALKSLGYELVSEYNSLDAVAQAFEEMLEDVIR